MKISSKFRRFIRRLVRNSGFIRRIAPDFVDVMKHYNIDVVLDIGANDGDYGREIRDRGYKGLIVSFEPNPKVFKRLEDSIKSDPNWIAYQLAFGDVDSELELLIPENDTMSSFKKFTNLGLDKSAKGLSTAIVEVVTLETFLNKHPEFHKNVYLKMDTQGYEMEILLGAQKILHKISAIQAEVALIHTYKDEVDWLDFISWLRSKKFELATAVCNSAIGPKVREFDFVFVKK